MLSIEPALQASMVSMTSDSVYSSLNCRFIAFKELRIVVLFRR